LIVYKQVKEKWQYLNVPVTKSDIPAKILNGDGRSHCMSQNVVANGHGISQLLVITKSGKVRKFHFLPRELC